MRETSLDAIARIHRSDTLIERFGSWPTFEDAEIQALHFDRGNHLEVVERGAWDARIPESMTARLLVADVRHAHMSPFYKPTLVVIRFETFGRFTMEGFNYQNPVIGIAINLEFSELRKQTFFAVEWGGTALKHDVSFTCESISIISVEPTAA
jgi:hypothetical protein